MTTKPKTIARVCGTCASSHSSNDLYAFLWISPLLFLKTIHRNRG